MQAFAADQGTTDPSFCHPPEGKGTFLKNCSPPLWTPLPFKKLSSNSSRKVGKVRTFEAKAFTKQKSRPRTGTARNSTNYPTIKIPGYQRGGVRHITVFCTYEYAKGYWPLAQSSETRIGGERGIRTPGGLPRSGFQDHRLRPLGHLSKFSFRQQALTPASPCLSLRAKQKSDTPRASPSLSRPKDGSPPAQALPLPPAAR